uniref:Nuclear receptor n=1 Tax=Rhabditophanes sp. KR3021 TaxID=114890 RepID=A0AC35U222_9BILA
MSETAVPSLDGCIICGSANYGLHHQVQCCKACLMFFLRSAREHRAYQCKRNTKDCPIVSGNGRMCRYCRYEKIKKSGMIIPKKDEDIGLEDFVKEEDTIIEVSEACKAANPNCSKATKEPDSYNDVNSDYLGGSFESNSSQNGYSNGYQDIHDTQNIYNTSNNTYPTNGYHGYAPQPSIDIHHQNNVIQHRNIDMQHHNNGIQLQNNAIHNDYDYGLDQHTQYSNPLILAPVQPPFPPNPSLNTSDIPCKQVNSSNCGIKGDTALPTRVCIKKNKVYFDVDAILTIVKTSLHGHRLPIPEKHGMTYSPLQSLCYALGKHLEQYEFRSREDISVSKEMSCKSVSSFQLSSFKILSFTLMYCPEFCALTPADRVHIFNNLYPVFNCIERCYSSIKMFGKDNPRTILLVNGTHATDGVHHPEINDIEINDAVRNELQKLMNPVTMYQINALYKPLKELNLCMLEFAYLIGTALWDVQELDAVSSEGKEYAKKILQSFNDELHSFYTISQFKNNYSYRLAEMIKIISKAQKYISLKSDSMLACKVFNIFDCSSLFCEKMGLSKEKLDFLIN